MNFHLLFFWLIQLNAAIFFPIALAMGAEALVSIQRIEEFLSKDEKNEAELGLERRISVIAPDTKGKQLSFVKWSST